ncbi:MAG: dicarboxylate/amino acid:cation symporter [Cytophagales bacterium]|nr:dicarboxylate/amino acid:cation symporter [Cytophagales bacterium]
MSKNLLSRFAKMPRYTKILVGMTLGIIWGLIAIEVEAYQFTINWIKPFGKIFIHLLKLIAVPIVLVSLIDGISNLHELSKLSRIGSKTIGLYLGTTVIAITIGLIIVNTIQPGEYLPQEKQQELKEKYVSKADLKVETAQDVKKSGPLRMLEDLIPPNIVEAARSNKNMLQIIFFAFLFGLGMVILGKDKVAPIKSLLSSTNQVLLKIVELIMAYAPFGVFALLASLIVDLAADGGIISLFAALGTYVFSVLISLALMIFVIYPLFLRFFVGVGYIRFLKGILPAQMLAFSTSSSAATLPVTLRQVEKRLGVSKRISSFVLPLGATINMDGTSIHQAVSAVFIAQAFGVNLDFSDQLIIVVTATLSSIGSAAVPSAGLIMLVIVLGAIGVDPAGLALIIALDRPLDMCRTMVNVTGDASVATFVAKTEGEWKLPDLQKEDIKQ